ncbi:MAG: 2-oxoglutarate and iron-dependent oxygenase domain-containing protein [Ktedonobacteraceae bacterium]
MTDIRLLSSRDVPILSLLDYQSADDDKRSQYIKLLRRSIDELGFLVIADHPVNLDLLDECYRFSKSFFDLPLQQKLALQYKKINQKSYSNVGYFPYKSEQAVRSIVPDLKEFYHIGPTLPYGHTMHEYYAENVWPDGIPGFEKSFRELYQQFTECGNVIIRFISEAFGVNLSYTQNLVDSGNSVLRTIHYPPVRAEEEAMRAAPHTGIQLLGLQPRTTHPGLQLYTPPGEWIRVSEDFRTYLIVNIGEMLAYLLGNKVKPTLHRVVNAQDGSEQYHRYAIVFFYHANSLQYLRPINFVDHIQEPILVGDWLLKRLRELGLFSAD